MAGESSAYWRHCVMSSYMHPLIPCIANHACQAACTGWEDRQTCFSDRARHFLTISPSNARLSSTDKLWSVYFASLV